MSILVDCEGLRASLGRLRVHWTCSAEAGTRCSGGVRKLRRALHIFLFSCVCYIVMLWRPPLADQQLPVKGLCKRVAVQSLGINFSLVASWLLIPRIITAYHGPLVCLGAPRGWQSGLSGARMQKIFSDTFRRDGSWLVLYAAAILAPQVTGDAPEPIAEQQGRPGIRRGFSFTSGGNIGHIHTSVRNTRPAAAAAGREPACEDPPKKGRQLVSSKGSSNTTTCPLSKAANAGTWRSIATVGATRGEMVHGPRFHRSGLFNPRLPSASSAKNGTYKYLSCGVGKLHSSLVEKAGVNQRKLTAVASSEEYPEEGNILASQRAAQPHREQPAELTTEQHATGRADEQTVNQGFVGHHAALASGNQVERGAARRYEEGDPRRNQWRVAPPDSPEGAPGQVEQSANSPSKTGEFQSKQPGQDAGMKADSAVENGESYHEEAVLEGYWWRKPSKDPDDSVDHGAPAELSSPDLRSIHAEARTTPVPHNFGRKEKTDLMSNSLSYQDRFYHAKDTPKTYGESDDSAVAPFAWKKSSEPSLAFGTQYRQQWLPDGDHVEGTDAQNKSEIREFSEGEVFDEVEWTDPESILRAESFLRNQMRALERHVATLEDQLKGVEADVEVYRAGIEGVNPRQHADTFEKLVRGGQSSSQQVLLEKLRAASESLESRVKMYVRTNTTFYASQLNDIVQVRLAPLRQGVLDLSMSLMDAASSTIDVTRQLHEAASHVNATTAREAGQMEALRARREAAFIEALEQEEIAMQGQLVASKQREQRRVNKSSVEQQILLTAIEGAVEDLNKRGFAVLDFSAVYPESEARKVLDLTLYFVDLQTRQRGWEVLPIVVVPSSGFEGRTDVPQAASDWLTSALVFEDGALPAITVDPVASAVPHQGGVSAEHEGRRRQDTNHARTFESAKGALPTLNSHRRSITQILEDDTTMADAFTSDADFDSGVADDGGEHSVTAKQNKNTMGARTTQTSRRDSESRMMLATLVDPVQAKGSPSTLHNTGNTPSTDLNGYSSAGDVQQGYTAGRRFPSGNYAAAQDGGMPTNANVGATLRKLDEGEKQGAGPTREHFSALPLRRVGVLEMNMKETRRAKPIERNGCATERACSGNRDYRGGTGIIVDLSSLRRKQSRRLSVLEGALGGHYIQALMQSRTRRTQRNKNVKNTPQGGAGQTGIGQLLRATQFILGESYAEEDQAETGRWHTGVLRQTHAVVASWLRKGRRARGETWDSRGKCSILPPTSTLQHLVREHFRTLSSRQTETDLLSQRMGARLLAAESTPQATGGTADGDSVDVHSPASTTAAPNVKPTRRATARGRKEDNSVQDGALGSRLGYYVLRAEQILLEGFYVAPGGEVSSVLLRYPHLRDLGPLVPASQYGVQLLRQLVMFLYAKSQLRRGHSLGNVTAVAEVALADKNEPHVFDGRTMRKKHNHRSDLQEQAYPTAQPQQRVAGRRGTASEGVRVCTPASYNPFSGCLSTPRLPGLAQGSHSSAAGVTGTEGPSGDGHGHRASSATEEDPSHWDVSPDHASTTWAGARQLAKHARLEAGSNYGSRARVDSSQVHTRPQTTLGSRPLEDAKDADKEELSRRKVLIIHLGPRSDGLPLDYTDGAGGKALQRQRLLRHSLVELLASSGPTDGNAEDCGNCSAGIGGTRASEPPGQEPDKETKLGTSAAKEGVSLEKGFLGTAQDAKASSHEGNDDVHTARKDEQQSAHFGDLDGGGAASINAVKLAKSLQGVHLESAVVRQLLALAQELQLASPSRWAADGALVEKYLENHQVEISVAWGRPPPALHLPLTPFFTRNILLIRVEVEKCPKKYGDNSYSVPPNSVVEHALYLLAHPVAGLAAIAAFHHGRNPSKRLLKQLRKAHKNLDVTASAMATHAAHFWGRATGASRDTFWIAQIRIKAPGHPTGSAIELLDGRLSAEAGFFVPSARMRNSDGHSSFPAEVEAWGWSYAEPLQPDEGPFLQGRLAGYGEVATTCKPVEALVQTTAANLQARVIPHAFVSDLRGRTVVLAISSTEMPFKGEQIVSPSG